MTGPEHFRQAEDLAAKAGEYLARETGKLAPPSGPPSLKCMPPWLWPPPPSAGPTPGVKSLRARAEAMSAAALAIQLRRCHRMAAATWHTGVTRRVGEAAASGGLA